MCGSSGGSERRRTAWAPSRCPHHCHYWIVGSLLVAGANSNSSNVSSSSSGGKAPANLGTEGTALVWCPRPFAVSHCPHRAGRTQHVARCGPTDRPGRRDRGRARPLRGISPRSGGARGRGTLASHVRLCGARQRMCTWVLRRRQPLLPASLVATEVDPLPPRLLGWWSRRVNLFFSRCYWRKGR